VKVPIALLLPVGAKQRRRHSVTGNYAPQFPVTLPSPRRLFGLSPPVGASGLGGTQ
jgi:hypothetical protein